MAGRPRIQTATIGPADATARMRAAFDTARIGDWDYDIKRGRLHRSPLVDRLFGFPAGVRPRPRDFRRCQHPDDVERIAQELRQALAQGDTMRLEFRVIGQDGMVRWLAADGRVFRDETGAAVRAIGTLRDITARQATIAALDAERNQNALLLRELAHRVKNSLQVMSSLLSMQRHRATSPETQDALAKAAQRAGAVAEIYATLTLTGENSRLDLAVYLERLASRLVRAAGAEDRHVTVTVEAEPAIVSADRAIAYGLIVNELATNALKHAFAPHQSGVVRVCFARGPEAETLSVSDNGPGLPEGAANRQSGGGLAIVTGLVERLGGALAVENRDGACFTVHAPIEAPGETG